MLRRSRRPWPSRTPARIAAPAAAATVALDQVFIGACTGGRLEDLAVAARIQPGPKGRPLLKAIVVPASVAVLQEAIERGYVAELLEAGFVLGAPSCGPCGRIDKGVLGPARCA